MRHVGHKNKPEANRCLAAAAIGRSVIELELTCNVSKVVESASNQLVPLVHQDVKAGHFTDRKHLPAVMISR